MEQATNGRLDTALFYNLEFSKKELKMRHCICILACLLTVFICTGCAKTPTVADLSLAEQAAYSDLDVYMMGQRGVPEEYIFVEMLEAVDCKRNAYSSYTPTPEAALEALKVSAVQHGATGLIDVYCQDVGVSWENNCWQTQICKGTAIQKK